MFSLESFQDKFYWTPKECLEQKLYYYIHLIQL